MSRYGFAPIFIILVAVAAVLGGAVFYYTKVSRRPVQVACTQEAKQCLDGSYVGRTGPNCEFAACPIASISTPAQPTGTTTTAASTRRLPVHSVNLPPASLVIDTSTWKTYKNINYYFRFSYPADHTPYVSADVATGQLVPATNLGDSVTIAENESDVFLGKGKLLSIQAVNVDERISTWLDDNLAKYAPNPAAASRKDIIVDGRSGVEITAAQPAAGSAYVYKLYVIKPGNYFLVIMENAKSALFDAIFSTLSFTPH